MPILTDINQAMEQLQMMVQNTIAPTLTEDELDSLLVKNRRGTVWATATTYAVGDVVVPSTLNGHRYICTVGGVSSTEPTWGTSRESAAADGDVRWEELGEEFDLWDLTRAAYEGWLLKAAKASCNVDFAAGDANFRNSQIPEFCLKMADRYRSVRVA